MTKINDRIKAFRVHKSLNQNEFSKLLGVAKSTLSEVESGKTKPSIDILIGIANNFDDVNIEWFLTGNGSMLKSAGRGRINDSSGITDEEAQYLGWLRNMLPEQKKDALLLAEKFGRWNQEIMAKARQNEPENIRKAA
jgi:transcriptional regulator with XRE-family HTH domain